jgi:hypothetical protein
MASLLHILISRSALIILCTLEIGRKETPGSAEVVGFLVDLAMVGKGFFVVTGICSVAIASTGAGSLTGEDVDASGIFW